MKERLRLGLEGNLQSQVQKKPGKLVEKAVPGSPLPLYSPPTGRSTIRDSECPWALLRARGPCRRLEGRISLPGTPGGSWESPFLPQHLALLQKSLLYSASEKQTNKNKLNACSKSLQPPRAESFNLDLNLHRHRPLCCLFPGTKAVRGPLAVLGHTEGPSFFWVFAKSPFPFSSCQCCRWFQASPSFS